MHGTSNPFPCSLVPITLQVTHSPCSGNAKISCTVLWINDQKSVLNSLSLQQNGYGHTCHKVVHVLLK